MSEPEEQLERLLKDAEVEVQEGDIQGEGKVLKKEQVERPMPRVTEADKNNNTKSLNRALQRTIYLVVKNGYGQWGFPSAELARHESLHTVSRQLHLTKMVVLRVLNPAATECGEDHRPNRRSEHEYLDRGKHTDWPSCVQVQPRHCQRGEGIGASW